MNFEELLVVPTAWRGRPITVAIATGEDPPVTIATIMGRLGGMNELEEDGRDAMVFTFAGAFTGAGSHARRRSTLVVRRGAVSLWIEPTGG